MTRFNLPDITFIETNAAELEEFAVKRFSELRGIELADKDARRNFMQAIIYVMVLFGNNVDYALKQRLLAFAEDDFLDHLGEKYGVDRLEPEAARTIFEFEVETIEPDVIKKGTRISVGDLFFETTEDVAIDPTSSLVQIDGVCLEKGTVGNGYLPGQVNQLVDPQPWIKSVKNITTTSGGLDWEENDPYAERIRLKRESLSGAGPEGAYEYFARSANQQITDVHIDSPSEGTVEIIVMLKEGMIPGQDILDQVLAACSGKKVRPMTDRVIVSAPTKVDYSIDLTYYITSENQAFTETIKKDVEAAVKEYQIWQSAKLGRGIDPTELIGLLKKAKAGRVELRQPASYQALTKKQIAAVTTVNVTFGGISDD